MNTTGQCYSVRVIIVNTAVRDMNTVAAFNSLLKTRLFRAAFGALL